MPEVPERVRLAKAGDASRLLEIAAFAQEKLTRAGSVQQIAGYSPQNVTERIERGELFVLKGSGAVIGSAFVEPVTAERFPQITVWNAVPDDVIAYFLYGLVIDPASQGRGWGPVLLDGIRAQAISTSLLLLDCWAGNERLRRFYTEAGFTLHGVFPEDDFEIAVFRWLANKKASIKH